MLGVFLEYNQKNYIGKQINYNLHNMQDIKDISSQTIKFE